MISAPPSRFFRRLFRFLPLAPLSILLSGAAPARPAPFHPTRTNRPPKIDGLLDEKAWKTAARIESFTMQLPHEGVPASEKTVVQVLYDDESLYLGITCFDKHPDRIRVSSLLRDDFAVSFGDQIAFAIDSSDSGRDGFWFSTNPGGAQLDSQIFDEGRVFDPQWDGIWTNAGRIDGKGWTAEIQIPFFNLRFLDADENTMRINFFRAIRHKNEEDYSPAIPRNYQGTFSFSLGRPVIFRGIRRGRRWDIKPYALANASSEHVPEEDSDITGDVGLDAKWGLTNNLAADFTLNPDFAQVEADDQQINLTRFPLFFPEKREFFLESAGLFAFGNQGDTSAFFSRRIGLDEEGRPVPIRGGARLTGRTGGWSLGLLDVVTEGTEESRQTNFSVARVRRDVGKRSSLGAIYTEREAAGSGGGNRVFGADTHLVFGEDLFLDAFAMGSRSSGDFLDASGNETGDGHAFDASLSRQGDRWRWGGYAGAVDEGFDPGVGFARRDGIQYSGGSLAFRPRPASLPKVRQLEFRVEASYVEGRSPDPVLDETILDRNWFLIHSTELESGDRVGAFGRIGFERVTGTFEIAEGVVVPEGDYDFDRFEINFETWNARKISGSGFLNVGSFYGGRRTALGGGLAVRFNSHLALNTFLTRNQIRLPGGDFDTNLWITRLNVAFTPRLFGGVLLQWNDVPDTFDLNLRVDFIHHPGSDLFIVYNETIDTDRQGGEPLSSRRTGITKLTYLFQF